MTLIGFRAWRVNTTGELWPLAVDQAAWPSERISARCAVGRGHSYGRFHLPPDPWCTCGVYAWKRPVDPNEPAGNPNLAVGVVLLWGRMCDGVNMTGRRAQHARIAALVPDRSGHFDATRYPSVRIYPDLTTMYGDWDLDPGAGWAKEVR